MVDGLCLLAKCGLKLLAYILHAGTQFLLLAGKIISVLFLHRLQQVIMVFYGEGLCVGEEGLLPFCLFNKLFYLFLGCVQFGFARAYILVLSQNDSQGGSSNETNHGRRDEDEKEVRHRECGEE